MLETAILGLKVLAIWGQLSLRPAREQPNVFDHREQIGIEVISKNNDFDLDCWKLWERVNGIEYQGHLLSLDAKILDISDFFKEEENISAQHVIIKYPGRLWGIKLEPGIGGSWKFYNDAAVAEYFKAAYKDWIKAKMMWRDSFEPDSFTGEVGVTIPLGGPFSVRPTGRYYYEWLDAKEDWSVQVRLKIDFSGLLRKGE